MLGATYGPWLVEITVERSGGTQTMSAADRARLASLFAAHQTAGGFLVIDPVAPMHLGSGPGSDVVLDGVDLLTSDSPTVGCAPPNSVEAHTPDGYAVHITGDTAMWCDTNARVTVIASNDPTHALVDEVKVRRVG